MKPPIFEGQHPMALPANPATAGEEIAQTSKQIANFFGGVKKKC